MNFSTRLTTTAQTSNLPRKIPTIDTASGLPKRFRVAGVAKRVGDATQNKSYSDCCLDYSHSHENKAPSIQSSQCIFQSSRMKCTGCRLILTTLQPSHKRMIIIHLYTTKTTQENVHSLEVRGPNYILSRKEIVSMEIYTEPNVCLLSLHCVTLYRLMSLLSLIPLERHRSSRNLSFWSGSDIAAASVSPTPKSRMSSKIGTIPSNPSSAWSEFLGSWGNAKGHTSPSKASQRSAKCG